MVIKGISLTSCEFWENSRLSLWWSLSQASLMHKIKMSQADSDLLRFKRKPVKLNLLVLGTYIYPYLLWLHLIIIVNTIIIFAIKFQTDIKSLRNLNCHQSALIAHSWSGPSPLSSLSILSVIIAIIFSVLMIIWIDISLHEPWALVRVDSLSAAKSCLIHPLATLAFMMIVMRIITCKNCIQTKLILRWLLWRSNDNHVWSTL